VLHSEKENRGAWSYGRWTERQWRQYQWIYYRLVESSDRLLGQVIDALERSAFKDNTLIVFTSDHGEMLGSHRLINKEKLYEESARVPLIFALPGKTGAVNTRSLTSGLDLMPTFLDFAGVPQPVELRGHSLRPLLEGQAYQEPAFVAAESFDPEARMIRTSRYKYIKYTYGENTEQFFDLDQDPHERRNLIAQPELVAEIERHRALLAKWMADTKDEFKKGSETLAQIKAREESDEDGKAKAKKK
jgi:choline-sulfatase